MVVMSPAAFSVLAIVAACMVMEEESVLSSAGLRVRSVWRPSASDQEL